MYIAKPTKQQLLWHDLELGVLIHYGMEIYRPELTGDWYKTEVVRTEIPPQSIHPTRLEPEQWIRSAAEMGAKYAVLVANHCTGFSLWDTAVNDFSIAHTDWRGGGGDICREFIDACKKYDLRPGFYYSTGCNGYYNINDNWKWDYKSDYYQEYVKNVVAQVTELWTEYGELFEIWFDGGIVPPEKGGPDLAPLLKKYQPNAITFQGPKDHIHNIRWVGTEEGLAPAECWATTNAGEARYDGTVPDENAGIGDPDGKYWWPAETDTPNRSLYESFGGGWAWKANEEKYVRTPEELLECYIHSVGRNSNLLLGMAISADGDFQDEAQFSAFGKLLKETFGTPIAFLEYPISINNCVTLLVPERAKYLVLRENITEGQRIRSFRILVNGVEVAAGECIGHKRILPLDLPAGEITVQITKAADNWHLRDIAVY